jgi:rhodanese-related sulfurtransferase
MANQENIPSLTGSQVPESNKTNLGLYVTPQEAYAMWTADPEQVQILDVRTFEEYTFVGHLEMAKNIPFVFPKYDPKGPSLPGRHGELNPDFVNAVKELFDPTDTILLYCATGGRGAMAVNMLAEAGFVNVYNIVNGLEGDRVDDPGSVYHGKHMRNGWKNVGLPWGYGFHPDLMYVTPDHSE